MLSACIASYPRAWRSRPPPPRPRDSPAFSRVGPCRARNLASGSSIGKMLLSPGPHTCASTQVAARRRFGYAGTMRAFIVGGAGFIGSHLADRLVEQGPVTL